MTAPRHFEKLSDPWLLIDAEKRRDRLVRGLCVAAWSVTFVLVLLFAAMTGVPVMHTYRLAAVGAANWSEVVAAAMPFFAAVWTLCLLVATLTTVGMFLRMRTASLAEIQLRLAALEGMIGAGDERR